MQKYQYCQKTGRLISWAEADLQKQTFYIGNRTVCEYR